MTRAQVKALHDKVNSILSTLDLDTPLNGLLLHSETLCVIRYEPREEDMGERSGKDHEVEEGQCQYTCLLQDAKDQPSHPGSTALPPVPSALPPREAALLPLPPTRWLGRHCRPWRPALPPQQVNALSEPFICPSVALLICAQLPNCPHFEYGLYVSIPSPRLGLDKIWD
jgi:hypothetical protein